MLQAIRTNKASTPVLNEAGVIMGENLIAALSQKPISTNLIMLNSR
jgi:hypothetical protein